MFALGYRNESQKSHNIGQTVATMSFDIPQLHFADHSPEAQVVERVMQVEHLGPAEAVRYILRNAAADETPAQRMIGLFSSDEDAAVMDEVMEVVAASRETQTTRKIGL